MKSSIEKLAGLKTEIAQRQAGVRERMDAAGGAVSAVFAAHKSVFEKDFPSCALGLCETKREGANFALVKDGYGPGGAIHATAALVENGMTLVPTQNSRKKKKAEITLPPEAVSELRKAEAEFLRSIAEENVLATMKHEINRRLNAAMDFAGTVIRMGQARRPPSKTLELEALSRRTDGALKELEGAALEIMKVCTETENR